MNNRQQTVYALSSRGYFPTSRPATHPTIILANEKSVHLKYIRCNEVWKGESEFRDPEAEEFCRESRSLPSKSQMSRSQITDATNNANDDNFRNGQAHDLRVNLKIKREERRLISRSFHSGGSRLKIQHNIGVSQENKYQSQRPVYEYEQTSKLQIPQTLSELQSFKSETLAREIHRMPINPSRTQMKLIKTLQEGAKMDSSLHLSQAASNRNYTERSEDGYLASYGSGHRGFVDQRQREDEWGTGSRVFQRKDKGGEEEARPVNLKKANILYDSRRRSEIQQASVKEAQPAQPVKTITYQPQISYTPLTTQTSTPIKENQPVQAVQQAQFVRPLKIEAVTSQSPQPIIQPLPQPQIQTQTPIKQPQPIQQTVHHTTYPTTTTTTTKPQSTYIPLPSQLQTPHKQTIQYQPETQSFQTAAAKSKVYEQTPSTTSTFFIKQTSPDWSSNTNEYQISSHIHSPNTSQAEQLNRLRMELAKRDRQLLQHKKHLEQSQKKSKSLQLQIKKLQTNNQMSTNTKYSLVSYPSQSAYNANKAGNELSKDLGGSANAFMYMVILMVLMGKDMTGK